MPDLSATQSNFLSSYRDSVNRLLDARASLKGSRELAATRDYPASLTDGAFAGANADLVPADVTAVFAAMDALEMVLTDFSTTPPSPTAHAAALLKFRR